LALGGLPEAHFPGEIIVGHQGALGSELARELIAVLEPDFFVERIKRLALPEAVELTGLRLEQTNTNEMSWWEIGEIRFLLGGAPAATGASVTAAATPHPFTAARLVDGDPLTVWRSWQPVRPGVVEVSLDRSIRADTVELHIPRGQHFPEYRCSYRGTTGNWRDLEPASTEERRETTPHERKRQAYRALRAAGVEYLVSNVDGDGHNIVATPIDHDPESWGLEEIWREGPDRIYRLLPFEPRP
jgi:hypothetical protein